MGTTSSQSSILPPNTIEIVYHSYDTRWPLQKVRTYSTTEQFQEAEKQLQTSLKQFMKDTFFINVNRIEEIVSIKCVGADHGYTVRLPIFEVDSRSDIDRL